MVSLESYLVHYCYLNLIREIVGMVLEGLNVRNNPSSVSVFVV